MVGFSSCHQFYIQGIFSCWSFRPCRTDVLRRCSGFGSQDLSFPVEDLGAIKAPRKIKDVKQRKTSLLVKWKDMATVHHISCKLYHIVYIYMFNLYINYIHIPFYIVCCWKTGRHIFSFHKTARDARDTDFFLWSFWPQAVWDPSTESFAKQPVLVRQMMADG